MPEKKVLLVPSPRVVPYCSLGRICRILMLLEHGRRVRGDRSRCIVLNLAACCRGLVERMPYLIDDIHELIDMPKRVEASEQVLDGAALR